MRVNFLTGDFAKGEDRAMAKLLRDGPGVSGYESKRRPTGEWTPLKGTLILASALLHGPYGEDVEDVVVEGFDLVMMD